MSTFIHSKSPKIVIIGGGLSGLCAGAYLVRDGFDVAIFEQSEHTGGYFRSFHRSGFMFDAGLKAVENAGMLIPMLKQLNIEKSVNLHKSKTALVLQDEFIELSDSRDIFRFYDALAEHFPDQRNGLKALLKEADKIAAWVNLAVTAPNPLFIPQKNMIPSLIKWLAINFPALINFRRTYSLLDVPMEKFLKNYISNQALINLLTELFFKGTPALFGLGYSRVFLDYYYPQDGMQSLTDALTSYISKHGGEIRTGTLVRQILVENNKVIGIELDDGQQIDTEYIVAAADMKRTYMELLGSNDTGDEFREQLEKAKIGESAFCVFLATDIDPETLPVNNCSHLYYLPDYDGTSADENMNENYFTRTPLEVSIPCINNRNLAPPGKSGLIISALAKYEFANNWGIRNGETTQQYYALKERIADQIVGIASKLIPELREHILFREIATPHTYSRYTLNSGGSICGWTYDRQETFSPKGIGSIQKSVLTPVEGLLQAGHWTVYPGGAPVCILSGRTAADNIAKKIKKGK